MVLSLVVLRVVVCGDVSDSCGDSSWLVNQNG